MPVVAGYALINVTWATSASISVVASSTLIYALFQSRQKLSTTLHRLLFGLSVCDIIFSTCSALHTIPAPVDTPNDIFTPAYGNQTTCNIQGFLIYMFGPMGPFYNAMLNIYFLCVVKYNLSNEEIEKKIEPLMHTLPILYCLSIAITAISKEYINPRHSTCGLNTVPENCTNIPDVVCERGDQAIVSFGWIAFAAPISLCLILIMGSLVIIYRTVRKQENIMSTRYRQTSIIRARSNRRSCSSNQNQNNDRLSFLRRRITNSREILHQAIGYVVAFLLSWAFLIISLSTPKYNATVDVFASIFNPMQGVFNFMVFIYPKVLTQLRNNHDYNLCQGLQAAIQGRAISRRRNLYVPQAPSYNNRTLPPTTNAAVKPADNPGQLQEKAEEAVDNNSVGEEIIEDNVVATDLEEGSVRQDI